MRKVFQITAPDAGNTTRHEDVGWVAANSSKRTRGVPKFRRTPACRRVALINTPLQRGDSRGLEILNRFNGLPRGFTLIELLIVISIIAILAGMILTVNSAVSRNKIKSRARTELNLVQMAIENYKSKMGHYPPDNPARPDRNPLYFELLGTMKTNLLGIDTFMALDGSAWIRVAMFSRVYGPGVNGFVNCSGNGGGDEASVARRFLGDLKPSQIGSFTNPPVAPEAKFLLCSIPAPYQDRDFSPPNGNRFRYVSSTPTNNPSTYDLWVDVVISGKTNRICNWSKEPLIVGTP